METGGQNRSVDQQERAFANNEWLIEERLNQLGYYQRLAQLCNCNTGYHVDFASGGPFFADNIIQSHPSTVVINVERNGALIADSKEWLLQKGTQVSAHDSHTDMPVAGKPQRYFIPDSQQLEAMVAPHSDNSVLLIRDDIRQASVLKALLEQLQNQQVQSASFSIYCVGTHPAMQQPRTLESMRDLKALVEPLKEMSEQTKAMIYRLASKYVMPGGTFTLANRIGYEQDSAVAKGNVLNPEVYRTLFTRSLRSFTRYWEVTDHFEMPDPIPALTKEMQQRQGLGELQIQASGKRKKQPHRNRKKRKTHRKARIKEIESLVAMQLTRNTNAFDPTGHDDFKQHNPLADLFK